MKTDKKLGQDVNDYLVSIGKETPMINSRDLGLSSEQQKINIHGAFTEIMTTLGLDLTDSSLVDTPARLSKMYIDELFKGLNYDNFPKCTTVENDMFYNSPVELDGIVVMTTCEHHFATIEGTARIRYVPDKKIIGLSKFNRIVDFFSRRPQIQERLTLQIFHALKFILQTEDVSVEIEAVHNCIKTRGVEQHGTTTKTSQMSGVFLSEKYF